MEIKILLLVLVLWTLIICAAGYKFMEKLFINLFVTLLIIFAYSYHTGDNNKLLFLACLATSACVAITELFNHK